MLAILSFRAKYGKFAAENLEKNKSNKDTSDIVQCISKDSGLFNKMKIFLLILITFGRWYWVKSVRIQSYSGPYFPAFGLNTERRSISPYSV